MYVGVDIGGTKTLLAVFDQHGVITEEKVFPTPKNYSHWLLELRHALAQFETQDFQAGAAGIPATLLDRRHGRGLAFGNLPWQNVPVQADLERICHCPFVVENDAKLAGLSEALLLQSKYSKVLYVTISTGVGYALVDNGVINTDVGDGGGRTILLEYNDKMTPWEDFASGRAIVERYGKKAKDITDEKTWQKIARDLAKGLIELIAVTEPEVIIFGGAVGAYFGRYGKQLETELKKYHLPLLPIPPLRAAERPEEAVIYGCYDLAKQRFDHAAFSR
jgi:predicted NBD/HSP70 family sugar kinase